MAHHALDPRWLQAKPIQQPVDLLNLSASDLRATTEQLDQGIKYILEKKGRLVAEAVQPYIEADLAWWWEEEKDKDKDRMSITAALFLESIQPQARSIILSQWIGENPSWNQLSRAQSIRADANGYGVVQLVGFRQLEGSRNSVYSHAFVETSELGGEIPKLFIESLSPPSSVISSNVVGTGGNHVTRSTTCPIFGVPLLVVPDTFGGKALSETIKKSLEQVFRFWMTGLIESGNETKARADNFSGLEPANFVCSTLIDQKKLDDLPPLRKVASVKPLSKQEFALDLAISGFKVKFSRGNGGATIDLPKEAGFAPFRTQFSFHFPSSPFPLRLNSTFAKIDSGVDGSCRAWRNNEGGAGIVFIFKMKKSKVKANTGEDYVLYRSFKDPETTRFSEENGRRLDDFYYDINVWAGMRNQ